MHGFDEFMGSLYHLNAEEEPEHFDYPKSPEFRKKFGPRGILKTKADGKGGQTIENLGPLTKKRMETIDDETVEAAKEFLTRQARAGKPFFVWWNGTRMHFRTHVKEANRGKSGQDEYSDGMVEHDMQVGELLKLIDDLGLADNTIVQYSTDNGPHYNTWPDAGTTPFHGEKNSNWEGAFRVPCFVRWPGHFPAGTTLNGIVSHEDWLPTFAAAAGAPDIKEKLLTGVALNGRNYKNHLDGYNLLDYLSGKTDKSPRNEFWYVNDDGELVAARYKDWKIVWLENRGEAFGVWREPFVELRVPLLALVTMRGQWGEFNPWQVPMSQATVPSLEAIGVVVQAVDRAAEVGETVAAAARLAFNTCRMVAVLISQRIVGAKQFK